jgi:hypothetical protein
MEENNMKGIISFVRPNKLYVPTGSSVGSKTIARWLGDDIQYDIKGANRWLQMFSEVFAGKVDGGYLGTGNTHSVMMQDEYIYLECEYVEEQKVLLTYEQMQVVLERYYAFLESDYKSEWISPEPFRVEYELESIDAQNKYIELGGKFS